MRSFVLVALVACSGPTPEGSWAGDMTCSEFDLDGTVALEKAEKDRFTGRLVLHGSLTDPQSGFVAEVDLTYDLDVITDDTTLDLQADFTALDCQIFDGTALVSENCSQIGLEEANLQDSGDDLQAATWDGEDRIDFDDGCVGQLTRQP